ncbi:hypothetical protein EUGRSUZ_F00848 [Eucalyptus grandis]|uniref:Uncharacterized protein n=2 Tax=Eucalyptus grandis TaxID=71139 RepID=A0ACC3KCM8_EUCGR|nr:hypothetical protein EUGRSUZ_F00848 [Eucalyptus grandis]
MSPEYAFDGKFSVKSDIFSFGVLLLEIVSGKRNRGFCHPNHHHNLLGHPEMLFFSLGVILLGIAWLLWIAGKSLELLHESLRDSFIANQVERWVQVGLVCVQKCPEDRPTMDSVIFMLVNEEAILPQPKQPRFFKERGPSSTEASSKGRIIHKEYCYNHHARRSINLLLRKLPARWNSKELSQ